MNTDEFWQIIDAVHRESGGAMDRKCELLKERLSALNEEDLLDFNRHFDAADAAAYTWPLWGAAYVIRGGCSDDAFSDFRGTLISLGREIYEQALIDPESLADIDYRDEEEIFYEGFQYVAMKAADERLGENPQRITTFPDTPSGTEWDEESVNSLYPRLDAKYAFSTDIEASTEAKKPWWRFW